MAPASARTRRDSRGIRQVDTWSVSPMVRSQATHWMRPRGNFTGCNVAVERLSAGRYRCFMGTVTRSRETQDGAGAMPDIEDRISRWLGAVLVETAGVEPPIEINISHAAVDQNRRLIRSYRIAELPMPAPEMYKLVEEISETLSSDAQDLGGIQRYQLVARCRGQDVGSTTIRHATDLVPSAIDSEPASARGLVAQAQRHAEAAVRMLVQGNGALFQSFQKRLTEQDALIERLYGRWIESMETKEQLVTERAALGIESEERKVANEVRAAKEIAEIERTNAMWKEGLSMVKFGLPLVMKYFASTKDAPPAAQDAAEAAYLATVTDEQVEQLRRRLPPELLDDFVAKVLRARASVGAPSPSDPPPQPERPHTEAPARERDEPPRPRLKPLEGDAKLGAARLLARDLLPVVTTRHLAGQPLIDPASDDLSLYQLLRRLAASTSGTEMQVILGSLPDDQRDATLALLQLLNIEPPQSTGVE